MSGNWKLVFESDDFLKWQYKDGPYRVVAFQSNRGHWKALFTSIYNVDSYLIKGNLGGGRTGRMKAKVLAKEFMKENKYGCEPPGEM